VVAFQNFEEFWAALDRLDLAIARMQQLQQQTAKRLAGIAKRNLVAPEQDGRTPNLDQIEATTATLGAMIARLVTTNASNERQLRNRSS
jgi:hypothetical protein